MNCLNIERISEDMFRINKYNFTRVPFADVVTTSAPYFHFQILEPEDEDPQLITTTTLRNSSPP